MIKSDYDELTYLTEVKKDLTDKDRKAISIMRKQRTEEEEEERKFQLPKSVFYFNNEPLKKPEYNHQVFNYINHFVGVEEDHDDHVQRFRFTHSKPIKIEIDEYEGFKDIVIRLDGYKTYYERVKAPEEKEWRNRTRKWFFGRFESDNTFYNQSFGFAQYDDNPIDRVHLNLSYSQNRKIIGLIKDELSIHGFEFK